MKKIKMDTVRRKKCKNIFFVGFLVILLVLFFVISKFYINYVKKITYGNVYNNITELSEQTATQLNLTIDNQKKFVEIMIDSINSGFFFDVSEIFNRFRDDLDSYHFTRLVILDEDGNGITSDGYNVNNYPNIQEFFLQEDVYLSENRPSTVSDNQVNIYSKTFKFKKKKLVLFATIDTDNYKEILSRRLFNGNGGTYLINNDGDVLIDSYDKIKNSNVNFYDYVKNEYNIVSGNDIKKLNKMQDEINNGNVGTFHILLSKKVYFLHYEKIKVNNWYVVTMAQDSTIASEIEQFLLLSFLLFGIIISLLLFVFIYMYLSNKKKSKKLYETAYIDSITKLGNEIYFKEKGKTFLANKVRNRYVMVIDINKFRYFNRLYDYAFSNLVLEEFGKCLTSVMPDDSIISRMSRDEFVSSFKYDLDINDLVDAIFDKVSKLRVDNIDLNLNVSIGIYKVKRSDTDINKVLDKAYMAHSKIKGMYRYNFYIFDELLEEKFIEEEQIESDMKTALANGDFKILYQPKISVKDEDFVGCEALVRWVKNDKVIYPDKFIPLFEKNKFIIKLDLYVFEQVCKDVNNWQKKYQFSPVVSVNVSKGHFVDEHFIDEYVKIADKYGVDVSKIDLEITETSAIDNNIIKILDYIKKKGFIISIDDFGTGYSSLSMLQNMPIDIIKIDKIFVDSIDYNSDKNIINYIVSIAKHLNIKTIVEGVETEEEVKFVKNLGCDIIQGYYYSKPLSKERMEEFFKKYNE